SFQSAEQPLLGQFSVSGNNDGAHNGRPIAMLQQEILGNRGGDLFCLSEGLCFKGSQQNLEQSVC
ncbi:hypothetical protein, partial [Pseudomonas aeruginosa]|uniref:hypothetical protein n=1 Tax=Pseudomonas aeruginosa TaxID=287 RepID=UPI001E3A3D57